MHSVVIRLNMVFGHFKGNWYTSKGGNFSRETMIECDVSQYFVFLMLNTLNKIFIRWHIENVESCFLGKVRKKNINLLSAELAQRVVKVKVLKVLASFIPLFNEEVSCLENYVTTHHSPYFFFFFFHCLTQIFQLKEIWHSMCSY